MFRFSHKYFSFSSLTQISDVFSYTPWLNVIYPLVYNRKYPKIARLFRSNAPGLLNLRCETFLWHWGKTRKKMRGNLTNGCDGCCGYEILFFFWEREMFCLFWSFFLSENPFLVVFTSILRFIMSLIFSGFHEWNLCFYLLWATLERHLLHK